MISNIIGPGLTVGPKVTEITGLNFRDFERDLKNIYSTSTMTTYMFRRASWRKITLDNFFLMEMTFLITKVLQSKRIWTNRRDLTKLLTKIRTETWVSKTFETNLPQLDERRITSRFKLKPYESQWAFLKAYPQAKYMYSTKGLLLDGKAGSGKTLNSIMWAHSIGDGVTIEIVPQNILYSVWEDTLTNEGKYWKGAPPKIWLAKSGTKPDPTAKHFVFHYEFLSDTRCIEYMKLIKTFNRGHKDFKLIVDEIHNFNELSSARTKQLIEIVDTVGFTDALPMSGTPFKALGREAYTTFAIIDPLFVGHARERFMQAYSRSRDKLNELLSHRIGFSKFTIESLQGMEERGEVEKIKVEVPNAADFTLRNIRMSMMEYITDRVKYYKQHLPEFEAYFGDVIARYREYIKGDERDEAKLREYMRIVNRFRHEGFTTFSPQDIEDSKYCKKVEEDIEAFLPPKERKQFRSTKSVIKYVGLKIRGEALGNVLGRARINAVRELVANADLPKYIDHVEKKTLIFTDYVDVMDEVVGYLTDKGYMPCQVYGGNSSERDSIIKKFEVDGKLNPLVTTFKSLREGYPLTMANQIIMMNAPWRSYILEQTLARIHRQGQDAPTFFWLVEMDTGNEENITSRSIDIMEWSAEQVDQIMGENFGHMQELSGVAGLEEYMDIMEEGAAALPPRNSLNIFDLL